MNTIAFVLMVVTMLLVTGATGYFFYKVLTTPSKPDTGFDDIHEDENRTFRYDAT